MAALTPFEQLSEKVESLRAALLNRHPSMPTLLQDIHRTLKAQPENVTLLSEDAIGVIVSGLQVQTSTSLAQSTSKAGRSAAATKNIQSKIATLGLDAI